MGQKQNKECKIKNHQWNIRCVVTRVLFQKILNEKNKETQLYHTYSADIGGWEEYGVDIWIWWNRRLSSTSGTAECLTSLKHCHRRSPCVCHSACGWASSSGLSFPGMFWVKVTWDVASRSVPHYHQKCELVHCLQERAVGWVMEKHNHQFYSIHACTLLCVMKTADQH